MNESDDDDDEQIGGNYNNSEITEPQIAPSAVNAITELLYSYSTNALERDLGSFAAHRKKATVNFDDVLLVARKDKEVVSQLTDFQAELRGEEK